MLRKSQKDLATEAGISTSTFNRHWHGERGMRLGEVEAILAALGTDYAAAHDDIRRLVDDIERE